MRSPANALLVILGIVILVALVVALESYMRRSAMLSWQTRVSANDALRRRLASKVVTQVGKQERELERMRK